MLDFYSSKESNDSSNVTNLFFARINEKVSIYQRENKRIPEILKAEILNNTQNLSCSNVAKLFRLDKSTVSRWRRKAMQFNTPTSRCAKSKKSLQSNNRVVAKFVAGNNFQSMIQEFSCFKVLQIFATLIIIFASTFLLVAEAKLFYAQDSNGSFSLLKALILEIGIVYISMTAVQGLLVKIFRGVFLSVLLIYSAYTVSSNVVVTDSRFNAQKKMLEDSIQSSREQLKEKEIKIQLMIGRDRLSSALKLENEKNHISKQIYKMEVDALALTSLSSTKSNIYALVTFRIIILLFNIFCSHHLKSFFVSIRSVQDTSLREHFA